MLRETREAGMNEGNDTCQAIRAEMSKMAEISLMAFSLRYVMSLESIKRDITVLYF